MTCRDHKSTQFVNFLCFPFTYLCDLPPPGTGDENANEIRRRRHIDEMIYETLKLKNYEMGHRSECIGYEMISRSFTFLHITQFCKKPVTEHLQF